MNVAAQARTPPPDEDRTGRTGLILPTQRQALIDNLQLEIAERARKLRAQYAFQAQSLRTRLEMRVNRIPTGLRKRNIEEFLNEHTQKSKPVAAPPLKVIPLQSTSRSAPLRQQNLKRKSENASEDKENESAATITSSLDNPKKKAKTTQANSKAVRSNATNNNVNNGVLSPKSHNSRPVLTSPSKNATTLDKLGLSRPASPLKALKRAISKPILQAGSRQQAKRAAKDEGRSSEGSDTSNATTIVKRTNSKKGTARKPPVPKTTTATRKPAATKKEVTTSTSAVTGTTIAGGRTLRKRG